MSSGIVPAHIILLVDTWKGNNFFSGIVESNTVDIIFTKVINDGEGGRNTKTFDQLSNNCTLQARFDGEKYHYITGFPKVNGGNRIPELQKARLEHVTTRDKMQCNYRNEQLE